jgi:hypothetical protein
MSQLRVAQNNTRMGFRSPLRPMMPHLQRRPSVEASNASAYSVATLALLREPSGLSGKLA